MHMNQTTYVVSFARIFMFCAVYLSILWLLYTYTYSMIGSKRIYHFHIVLTILLFVIIIITALWSNQWIEAYSGQDFIKKATLSAETGQFVVGALLTLVTAQLLVPINLIMGWFKNRKRKASSR
ncbi:hypothetical protein PIECOFPK_02825 [Mycovorax composti]|uniref:Uncharacterized protein n=2 Tax=Chitinophagaceae TaxID=563835 RepID=A0ABZ2EP67_9BACT